MQSFRRILYRNAINYKCFSTATVTEEFTEDAEEFIKRVGKASKSGSNLAEELPIELQTRMVDILKLRTKRQLDQINEKYIMFLNSNQRDMKGKSLGFDVGMKDCATSEDLHVYGANEVLAYIAYHLGPSFSVNKYILHQIQHLLPNFIPNSVLDFGAGPGTSSWAANETFSQSIKEYKIVEPSGAMNESAKMLLKGFPGLSWRNSLKEMLPELHAGQKHDLVIGSHVLSELPNDISRVAAITFLWRITADNGILVLADRGNPWGSHIIRSARQLLLDSPIQKDEVPHIIAPCTHKLTCPLDGTNSWCHFAKRVPKVGHPHLIGHERHSGINTKKFSYIAIQKKKESENNLNQNKIDELQWGRLIRPPIQKPKHIIMDMCSPEGDIHRRTLTKGKSHLHCRQLYRHAKKSNWGGLWPY